MNIACPRKLLMDGLNRLKKGVEIYTARPEWGEDDLEV